MASKVISKQKNLALLMRSVTDLRLTVKLFSAEFDRKVKRSRAAGQSDAVLASDMLCVYFFRILFFHRRF